MDRAKLRIIAGLGAVLLASLLLVAPASAGHHNDGSKASGYTEDNDGNDGATANNVSDDGDNKHPSGKDRSVENGKSGNQGKSGSDPDGDSNGGADKPNGSGGNDLADQDGNNGCGNDDDFEDDNNGNCGPKDKNKGGPCVDKNDKVRGKSAGKGKGRAAHCNEAPPATTPTVDDEVQGGAVSTDPDNEVLGGTIEADTDTDDTEVLGERVTNEDDAVAAERESRGSALPFTGGAILAVLGLGVGLVASGYVFTKVRPSKK